MKVINERRSVREFCENDLISRSELDLLVRAGMQAPSAKNAQPWEFLVVDEKEIIKKLGSDIRLSPKIANATALILVCGNRLKVTSPLYHQDLAAATQNILLEATSLGIGSYWIGLYETIERSDAVRMVFNLPTDIEPFSLVALGHPKDTDALRFIDRYNSQAVRYNRWR